MKARVLLLFDGLKARSEALKYAVELATRMDCTLVLLLLLRLDPSDCTGASSEADVARSLEELCAPHLQAARRAGVEIEPVLKIGDPYSEITKYLAETRAVHTIVWGGERRTVTRRPRAGRRHWLARIREQVDLPVVVPSLRS